MAFILPKCIIKEIGKHQPNILWKGVAGTGYSKVAWPQVCNPVDEGELGVRDIQSLNLTLMSRQLWDVIQWNPFSLTMETQSDVSTANFSNRRFRQELESSQHVENSGFTLISSSLTEDNYLVWSRGIRFAPGARKKLGYIDRRSICPTDDSEELDEWIRIDCMVITWILNIVSKEIVDSFIYATSARSLWLDLDTSVEKQLLVQVQHSVGNTIAVYQVQHRDLKYQLAMDKRSMLCDYCKKSRHLKENCFKLHGTLEWYKDLIEKKRNGIGRASAEYTFDDVRINFAYLEDMEELAGHKGYKLFDLESQSYIISRDVLFYEHIFPFSISSPSSLPPCSLPLGLDLKDAADNTPTSDTTHAPINPNDHSSIPQPLPLPSTPQHHSDSLSCNSLLPHPSSVSPLLFNLFTEICKATLAAKGFSQIEGIDYVDCFSPVLKVVIVRLFLAISSAFAWPLHQLDVNNVFLQGYLDEEIYMLPLEEYSVPTGHVCKLQCSLYGLKQASRQWNQEFTLQLIAFGFSQSTHDHCPFLKGAGNDFIALLVYLGDVLLTSSSSILIADVKAYLDGLFTIKDLGLAYFFLGYKLRAPLQVLVLPRRNIYKIFLLTLVCKMPNLLLLHCFRVLRFLELLVLFLSNPAPYRRLVGRLLYLGFTRPDISYGVQQFSQYLQQPCDSHWEVALHIVRYLKGTPTTGLFFPCSNFLQLQAFCDADWASCLDTRLLSVVFVCS
ncbi:UNVERIFIED_CONTAM: putative mitochondrial protein [Sesamum angustifolium]|uniref:Mitochondrial protein n=1 Tax=Sesamum angustifolium TaxID=2727405 RepID=A0AAW2PWK0_9LAMI